MPSSTPTPSSQNANRPAHAATTNQASTNPTYWYDPASNFGYGIGRLFREAFDLAYHAWGSWWNPHPGLSPQEVAHLQHNAYVAGLKECVQQLGFALENVRKNPHDLASVNKIDELVQRYAGYMEFAPTIELAAYQKQLFQPLHAQIEKLPNVALKQKLRILLPVLERWFPLLPKDALVQQAESLQADEYDLALSQSYYGEKKAIKNPSRQKRQAEQTSPPLTGVNLDNQIKDMVIQNGYAYTANGQSGLKILDVSNPTNVTLISQYDTPGDAQRIVLDNGYAYIADGTGGLQIINIKNVTNPLFAGVWMTGNPVTDVAVLNGKAYIADGTDTLTEIDVRTPESVYQAIIPIPYQGKITVFGNFLYVTKFDYVASDNFLHIFDVSNPRDPKEVEKANIPNLAVDVVVGDYAYGLASASSSNSGLQIIDIRDTASPKLLGSARISFPENLAVLGNYAYVTDSSRGGAGLHIIDVSNVTNPREVGHAWTGYAFDVVVSQNFAYVIDGSLRIINVSYATHPQVVGTVSTLNAYHLAVSGNFAYVAGSGAGIEGLYIMDVTNDV